MANSIVDSIFTLEVYCCNAFGFLCVLYGAGLGLKAAGCESGGAFLRLLNSAVAAIFRYVFYIAMACFLALSQLFDSVSSFFF